MKFLVLIAEKKIIIKIKTHYMENNKDPDSEFIWKNSKKIGYSFM